MAKYIDSPITFIGGPYHFQKQKMTNCIKTNKIKSKDYIGHYDRDRPDRAHMTWKESEKRWYLIDSEAIVTKEKIAQLGCWAVDSPLSWKYVDGKNILVRFIGIDIDSPFSAFELYYAEHIKFIYSKTYTTLYDLKVYQ